MQTDKSAIALVIVQVLKLYLLLFDCGGRFVEVGAQVVRSLAVTVSPSPESGFRAMCTQRVRKSAIEQVASVIEQVASVIEQMASVIEQVASVIQQVALSRDCS